MDYETILINDSNGKQQKWIIENDMGDERTGTYTIYKMGTIKTIAKRDCYENNGVLYSLKTTDIITREDENFKECLEQCYVCGKKLYKKDQIRVDENDHYLCKGCSNKSKSKTSKVVDILFS